MDTLGLSLRQKKLLHFLRGREKYITGDALARQLGVSSRTIRSDVAGINQALSPFKARILSQHSKGYLYVAEDPEAIQSMNQIDIAFLTQDERVRYLAFRFCLSDDPIDIYDLEDEVFVSHTTLEHDLRQLKMKYVLAGPRIRMIQEKNALSFEKNEQKRRLILNHLFHEGWDYHGRENAYYSYHFLERAWMDTIMRIIPSVLSRHGIRIEDPDMVALNLAAAIMIHRVRTGHPLPERSIPERYDVPVSLAVDEIFQALSEEFSMKFPSQEQDEIYRFLEGVRLPDMETISPENAGKHFDGITIHLADDYIRKIRELYHLDLSGDRDFYITLLLLIKYLRFSDHIFNEQDNHMIVRENLLPEFEIAWAIQDLSQSYLGYYLNENGILQLARVIAGALEFYTDTHPEHKLKTVICCHLNMTSAWALKRKVLAAFDKYLDITELLPVNIKDAHDFKGTDLILSTVRKKLTDNADTDTIFVNTLFPPEDYLHISAYIQNYRIRRLYPAGSASAGKLLADGLWMEKPVSSKRFEIIEAMAGLLIESGTVNSDYETDILRREAISSFCIRPGVLFLHSLVSAVETRLCTAVFEHQVIWNGQKIRFAVMGAFAPSDTILRLWLNQTFHDPSVDPELLKKLRTKEDIIRFYSR